LEADASKGAKATPVHETHRFVSKARSSSTNPPR
jgi:hypothetical protein